MATNIDKSFFKRLEKLFSTSVIINKSDGERKVIDVDKLQAYSNLETNRQLNKFTGARSSAFDNYLKHSQTSGYEISKNELYKDYDKMDADPILASAIDIYADDATVKNEFGNILAITSEDEKIYDALYNLFYDILNIEFNLWTWIRSMTKYGDFYLKLEITEKIGITNIIPISPYSINREEDPENSMLVRFRYDPQFGANPYAMTGYTKAGQKDYYFQNYEIAHFRLIADTNYLPYGRSIFEPARRVWKQIVLMEDAMLIHRIMRAPEKRIFKIDIGAIPPNEVDTHMNNIINKIRKVPYIDPATGEYNLEFNLQNLAEDFFLPVRGGNTGTEIDTLSGMEFTGIEDIEYLQRKMFAALKLPKAFLNYEEELNSKANLASEDARFSRTIERLQRIVVSELTKIAIVHLYSQGFKDNQLVNFKLELTTPSIALETEKIEMWTQKISLARDMKELKLLSDEFIYENIFNMSKEQYQDEKAKIVENLKMTFRYNQIEDEGNDPAVTKDVAGKNDENEDDGDYTISDSKDKTLTSKTFAANEANFQSDKFIKSLNKRKKLIFETFKEPEKEEYNDDGTFLDEKNLIENKKKKK